MPDPDAPAYVSEKRLENSESGPPIWHPREDCPNLQTHADNVVELTVAEAEEECVRQAQCCSTIPALEDLD